MPGATLDPHRESPGLGVKPGSRGPGVASGDLAEGTPGVRWEEGERTEVPGSEDKEGRPIPKGSRPPSHRWSSRWKRRVRSRRSHRTSRIPSRQGPASCPCSTSGPRRCFGTERSAPPFRNRARLPRSRRTRSPGGRRCRRAGNQSVAKMRSGASQATDLIETAHSGSSGGLKDL